MPLSSEHTDSSAWRHLPITTRLASSSPLGRIQLAGLIRDSQGVPETPMRRLGAYGLVYTVYGDAQYEDATGLHEALGPGDLLLLFPDIPHTYGPSGSRSWTELYFVFDGPVFDLWRREGVLDPAWPLRHLEPVDAWLARFESVLGAPRTPGVSPPLLEICRLQLALGEALSTPPNGRESRADIAWADHVCALLNSDLDHTLDLNAVADAVGMSYDGFRKRFTRIIGMPPARYRATRIIERACELMQGSGLSDRQIAFALGFRDPAHFSRRFKQLTGRSPRHFRAGVSRVRSRLEDDLGDDQVRVLAPTTQAASLPQ